MVVVAEGGYVLMAQLLRLHNVTAAPLALTRNAMATTLTFVHLVLSHSTSSFLLPILHQLSYFHFVKHVDSRGEFVGLRFAFHLATTQRVAGLCPLLCHHALLFHFLLFVEVDFDEVLFFLQAA